MGMENHIEISVKSSSGDSYAVKFYLGENKISASCSCPAGIYHKLCKHIMHLISDDYSILYDKSQKVFVKQVISHMQKTNIPLLLCELNESEMLLKKAQTKVKNAKINLEKEILQK